MSNRTDDVGMRATAIGRVCEIMNFCAIMSAPNGDINASERERID